MDVSRADSRTQARRGRRSGERRRWDKRERDAEIMRMDALGAKKVEIAAALDINRKTVSRVIERKLAQQHRLEQESGAKVEQIRPRDAGILMHRRMGWQLEDIAEVFGVSPRTVRRVLKSGQNGT